MPHIPMTPQNNEIPTTHAMAHMPMAHAVIDPTTGEALEYRHLIKHPTLATPWKTSAANEFGRLAQGIGNRIKGTDTIKFIPMDKVPKEKKVTYGRFVCDVRPQKAEPNRTRLTVGGNLLDYPGAVSTKTADITTCKCLFNSVVSTPGAKYMTVDIKNFYLNTPLDQYEYMRIPLDLIPEEVINEYNLRDIANKGNIYMEIQQGMYGLKQAGILANKLLAKRLAKAGYTQTTHTPGLWKHAWRPITFTLVVDDFGVKYVGKEHAEHLMAALREDYEISHDWSGSLYCGITLKWDYVARTVDLSMPGYLAAVLTRFRHAIAAKPEHAPHKSKAIQYGVKVQLTDPLDDSPMLPPEELTVIQQVIGCILYYARAVDPTMLVTLSTLASQQSKGTAHTADAITQLLNYCATHPDAEIRYVASDMLLKIHSDASYLSEAQARSRTGGHFFLGNHPNKPQINNGAIHTIASIQRNVMASAAEAEVGALFDNTKHGTIIRTTLEELGHPQPPTPVQTDNSTASGIVNDTIKQQRSRAIDMRFYWVRDRIKQGQFVVYWAPGKWNLADYFTKHHPPAHHQQMRPIFLHMKDSPDLVPGSAACCVLRGCVNLPTERSLAVRDSP